jgi:cephalosporin hydroxylase
MGDNFPALCQGPREIWRSELRPEGPLAAVEAFLSGNPSFEVDGRWERYIITYNPKGYLRRIR